MVVVVSMTILILMIIMMNKHADNRSYALSIRDHVPETREVKHYRIRMLDSGRGVYITPRKTFSSLLELVAHYHGWCLSGVAWEVGWFFVVYCCSYHYVITYVIIIIVIFIIISINFIGRIFIFYAIIIFILFPFLYQMSLLFCY